MAAGSLESGWWWTQSRANPSPQKSLIIRQISRCLDNCVPPRRKEKNEKKPGIFAESPFLYARSDSLTLCYR